MPFLDLRGSAGLPKFKAPPLDLLSPRGLIVCDNAGLVVHAHKKRLVNKQYRNKRVISHLAEVFCGYTVILPTRHPMDIRQHLIFGFDELCLVRAENNKRRVFKGTIKSGPSFTFSNVHVY